MYSSIQRDTTFIQHLRDFIEEHYPIQPAKMIPAARGFYGETWRIDAPQGRIFAKLDCSPHQTIYGRSFPVMEHLRAHGIDFISQIVKTRDSKLYTNFEGGILGLFEWIDGKNVETDETKPLEYAMLARIYAVPAQGLELLREEFSSAAADEFYTLRAQLQDAEFLALLKSRREPLAHRIERLRHFSKRCAGDETGFVLTHGDAGGNLLLGPNAHLIDWDEAILSLPERDAWVMACRS